MAAQIITIAIEKGGAGKTVTASNLAYLMGDEGKKVLCIDTDPQGNLTSALSGGNGITSGVYNGRALFDMFDGFRYTKTKDYITETEYENVDMIPCSAQTPRINQRIPGIFEDAQTYFKPGDPKCLKNMGEFLYYFLNQVREDYDYIIIDCPPSLNMLTINALTAATSVLVPIQCEYYALEGLSQLIHTVELVKERLNPVLEIEGVVFTMYDARTNLSLQVVENVKENLQQNIYKTIIPRNIRLAEAPSYGMPINLYDPKSTGASAYQRLADEVMNRE